MIILPRRLRFLSRPAPVAAVAPVTDGDHGSARDRRAVRVTRLPPVARRSCRPRRVSRVCVRPPGRPGARPRSSGPFSGVSRRGQSPTGVFSWSGAASDAVPVPLPVRPGSRSASGSPATANATACGCAPRAAQYKLQCHWRRGGRGRGRAPISQLPRNAQEQALRRKPR